MPTPRAWSALVTRLLQLARIQSAPERREPVDVRAVLRAIAGTRYDGRVRLDLQRRAADRSCINPDHLETAVRNLLDNAVRHGAGSRSR